MLIHIESYIRQLLLPAWRQPRYVGLVRVLFQPIMYLLNRHDDFEREAIFRAGLTGQKLLLEYYLQINIEGSIYIEDRDGVRLDFAVIVPQSLSAADRKKVYDIVSTYKLASKRFELQDVFFSTAPAPAPILEWKTNHPYADGTQIILAVTLTGLYRTRIRAQGQTGFVFDTVVSYLAGQAQVFNVALGFIYKIEVSGLTATLDLVAPAGRICDLTFEYTRPDGDWLQITFVNSVRRVTAYLYSAYANLAPFTFRMYNWDALTATVGSLVYEKTNVPNPQPLLVDLPNNVAAGGGTYAVRFWDRDGCATEVVTAIVPAVGAPSICTISYDDSAGANTGVAATVVGQQYQIAVKIALPQAVNKTVTVKKSSDNTLLYTGGFTGTTFVFFLPLGTVQQPVKVEVTENDCTAGVRTISLPALPASGTASMVMTGGIELQKNTDGTWSIINTSMAVSMSRAKSYAYDNSGVGAFSQGTETSTWAGYVLINDVPLKAGDNRRDLINISLPVGEMLSIRVIWLEQGYYSNWSVVKEYIWRVREPRINAHWNGSSWENWGEGYSQYHPWKFLKQAQIILKT